MGAGNYRTHLWRAGEWRRATVHHVDGRLVLDLHVHANWVTDSCGVLMEDALAAMYTDHLRRAAGVLQPPVKLGARA